MVPPRESSGRPNSRGGPFESIDPTMNPEKDPVTEEELKNVWATHSVSDIAKMFETTEQTIYGRARAFGLPARGSQKHLGEGPAPDDPSPEEIEQRAAAIKASWTDEQRRCRCVDRRRYRYEIPKASFSRT